MSYDHYLNARIDENVSAYSAGEAAARAGLPRVNPEHPGTSAFNWWRQGYDFGLQKRAIALGGQDDIPSQVGGATVETTADHHQGG